MFATRYRFGKPYQCFNFIPVVQGWAILELVRGVGGWGVAWMIITLICVKSILYL